MFKQVLFMIVLVTPAFAQEARLANQSVKKRALQDRVVMLEHHAESALGAYERTLKLYSSLVKDFLEYQRTKKIDHPLPIETFDRDPWVLRLRWVMQEVNHLDEGKLRAQIDSLESFSTEAIRERNQIVSEYSKIATAFEELQEKHKEERVRRYPRIRKNYAYVPRGISAKDHAAFLAHQEETSRIRKKIEALRMAGESTEELSRAFHQLTKINQKFWRNWPEDTAVSNRSQPKNSRAPTFERPTPENLPVVDGFPVLPTAGAGI